MSLPVTQTLIPHVDICTDRVQLSYDDRFLRRKVLVSEAGLRFLVDLDSGSRSSPPRKTSMPSPAPISPGWPGISATATPPARSTTADC